MDLDDVVGLPGPKGEKGEAGEPGMGKAGKKVSFSMQPPLQLCTIYSAVTSVFVYS